VLIGPKGHYETMIVEFGSPNYAKVVTKMMDLEGNIIDVPSAICNSPVINTLGLQNSSLTSKRY
jgi:hypothetical protein